MKERQERNKDLAVRGARFAGSNGAFFDEAALHRDDEHKRGFKRCR